MNESPDIPQDAQSMNDFGAKLTAMAGALIDEVREADLDTKIDAFKALSAYFIAHTKLGRLRPDDDAESAVPSMAAMRERIRQAEDGGK